MFLGDGGSDSSFTSAGHLLGTLEVLTEGQEEDLKDSITWGWSGNRNEVREALCLLDHESTVGEWRLLLQRFVSLALSPSA